MSLRGRCAVPEDDLSAFWPDANVNHENIIVVEDTDTGALLASAVMFDGGHEAVPVEPKAIFDEDRAIGRIKDLVRILLETVRGICEERGRKGLIVYTSDPIVCGVLADAGMTPLGISYVLALTLTPDPAAAP